MKIVLNEEQSAALREWISDSSVTLHVAEGHSGYGLYASVNDYPEEGAEFIAPVDAAPQASPSVAPADSEFGSAVGPAGAAPAL
jgi:hypothetical protein